MKNLNNKCLRSRENNWVEEYKVSQIKLSEMEYNSTSSRIFLILH